MAEPKKAELVDDAEALGIDHADELTKPELTAAIDAANPPELGPVIREGSEPEPPRPNGPATVGVQPQTADDIPESGR